MITSFSEYRQKNSLHFDELCTKTGEIEPHWRKLIQAYDKMSHDEMLQKQKEVERQLRENGVTYNVYGDPEGSNRPWALDPVPMVFGKKDWANIEAGLKQRAELLNAILVDLYGSRKLIKSGSLPFELIYNHRGFLRQVDKIRIPGEH